MGHPSVEAIHDMSHYFVDLKNGSGKVHFLKPALTGRLACWKMLLSMYDIQYVIQKAIKGSVLAEYLPYHPSEDYQFIKFDFPEEDIMAIKDCEIPGLDKGLEPDSCWKLAFYGASNSTGHRIGAIIVSLNGGFTPFTSRLCFDCANNMAEYDACILSIEVAIDLCIKTLKYM